MSNNLPLAIIVDLDGTLCDTRHRKHFMEKPPKQWDAFYEAMVDDPCNTHVRSLIHGLANKRYEILLVTGRPEKYRESTKQWLLENGIAFLDERLLMRLDGDFRADDVVKAEIYDEHIEGKYNVRLVLDDRTRVVKMWRSKGLECWQVAEGDF